MSEIINRNPLASTGGTIWKYIIVRASSLHGPSVDAAGIERCVNGRINPPPASTLQVSDISGAQVEFLLWMEKMSYVRDMVG